jgi:acetylornithine/succinyldiaminopimelate/putrescine aminotransferase
MPLGAFVADKKIMDSFTNNPVLGHINTFGGHPVSCAAGLASMKILLEEKMIEKVNHKSALFLTHLKHQKIKNIHAKGLMIAVELDSFETNKKLIDYLIENGIFTDWFLFAPHCLRIAPPLNITDEEILFACEKINSTLNKLN